MKKEYIKLALFVACMIAALLAGRFGVDIGKTLAAATGLYEQVEASPILDALDAPSDPAPAGE